MKIQYAKATKAQKIRFAAIEAGITQIMSERWIDAQGEILPDESWSIDPTWSSNHTIRERANAIQVDRLQRIKKLQTPEFHALYNAELKAWARAGNAAQQYEANGGD